MDEVHFQQYGSRCRMWVPPEVKDPVLQHHPTRKSVGYFGAVRLRDGKFIFARELNRFDAVTTWNFLRLLERRSLNSRRRVIVITDNAKYHHAKLHSAWRQAHQAHFLLDYLPPYSPDLNPTERATGALKAVANPAPAPGLVSRGGPSMKISKIQEVI